MDFIELNLQPRDENIHNNEYSWKHSKFYKITFIKTDNIIHQYINTVQPRYHELCKVKV
jgi:hypothetical protein